MLYVNTRDQLEKFDPKSDEGIFVGYSERRKAYRIYNKRTNTIEETLHVSFDENFKINKLDDDEYETNSEPFIEDTTNNDNTPNDENEFRSPPRILKDHPIHNIIGDVTEKVKTRSQLNQMRHIAFIYNIKP